MEDEIKRQGGKHLMKCNQIKWKNDRLYMVGASFKTYALMYSYFDADIGVLLVGCFTWNWVGIKNWSSRIQTQTNRYLRKYTAVLPETIIWDPYQRFLDQNTISRQLALAKLNLIKPQMMSCLPYNYLILVRNFFWQMTGHFIIGLFLTCHAEHF